MKLVYAISKTDLTGTWEYGTTDEHRPYWTCSNCGKRVWKDPHDKRFCSNCGAALTKGA